jgi:hypothetical protein
LGDLVIAAFFAADKPRGRERKLGEYLTLVTRAHGKDGRTEDVVKWLLIVASLREGAHATSPFHWQIEFPEVFMVDMERKQFSGFDAMVGNPPFAGHVTLTQSNRDGYSDYLHDQFIGSTGKCDLVAFFFRRTFGLIRAAGTFGLIATNTIGQGDTRQSGLRWICTNGGLIYNARRRYKWPGVAAVVVSVVHVTKSTMSAPFLLGASRTSHVLAG